MNDDFAPGRLVTYETESSLILDPFGPIYFMTNETFAKHGFDPAGGYVWSGLLKSLVRSRHPAIMPNLHFNPESEMVSVASTSIEAVRVVASLMRELSTNSELLEETLKNTDPAELD
jgi:Immunity protein 51